MRARSFALRISFIPVAQLQRQNPRMTSHVRERKEHERSSNPTGERESKGHGQQSNAHKHSARVEQLSRQLPSTRLTHSLPIARLADMLDLLRAAADHTPPPAHHTTATRGDGRRQVSVGDPGAFRR